MTDTPELDEFKSELRKLKKHVLLKKIMQGRVINFEKLTRADVATLMVQDSARYFLLAAANLNRTQLKKATKDPETVIVEKKLRVAHAVKKRLPLNASFDEIVTRAESLRRADLGRKARGGIETLFRERLAAENIPVLMAPPPREVPGIVVSRRKPDGVWPDPAEDRSPRIYLEIKNVRRVADDIQKRLYEIVEASLEMKLLYGGLSLKGFGAAPPGGRLSAGRARRRGLPKASVKKRELRAWQAGCEFRRTGATAPPSVDVSSRTSLA
jgi:hypothetical protein